MKSARILLMSHKQEMLEILGDMIQYTEKSDYEKVQELSRRINQLMPISNMSTCVKCLDIDNCRQYCVFAVTMQEQKDEFLIEAKKIYNRIGR